jgi:metal iron transporter
MFTRLLGLIPSMVVAVSVGQSGVNALLVVSQVVLSIVLPFVTLPLMYFTSSRKIMSVRKPLRSSESGTVDDEAQRPAAIRRASQNEDVEQSQETVDFSNGKIVIGLGAIIWVVILAANVYVIVMLAIPSS